MSKAGKITAVAKAQLSLLRFFRALILPRDKGLVDFWAFWTTIANRGIVADWLVPCVFTEV